MNNSKSKQLENIYRASVALVAVLGRESLNLLPKIKIHYIRLRKAHKAYEDKQKKGSESN